MRSRRQYRPQGGILWFVAQIQSAEPFDQACGHGAFMVGGFGISHSPHATAAKNNPLISDSDWVMLACSPKRLLTTVLDS